ncbi:MAG: hypothetical protein QXM31_02280 [Candidatus Woesearchaeota archaeon]
MAIQGYTEFHAGRQPSVIPKSLLVLILIEIIVLILLFFWLPRVYGGTVMIGDRTITATGGGIVVNAGCEAPERPECKECPDCPKQPPCTCEEYCRQAYGKDKTKYELCLKERCAPETCEDTCRNRYGDNKDAFALCLRLDCNPGDPCETACWKKSQGSKSVYDACVQRECTSCEENCRTRYGTNKDAYALCLRLDCEQGDPCETACWKKSQGSPTAYQACVQRECLSCEELCRKKYANSPEALNICLKIGCGPSGCERECWESSSGSTTTYAYCVRQVCQTPATATQTGTTACRENDKGRDAQNKGTTIITTYYTDGTQKSDAYTDSCANTRQVLEYYCQGNSLASENIACPYGCDDGKCAVPPSAPEPSTFTPITISPTLLRTVSLTK